MSRPRIFLSAVSTELRTARQAVARIVRALGYDPVSQDDFPTGHGELRKWLREQINSCDGLIQLVGDAYGAEPPNFDVKYGRVSYTQFELLCAIEKGRKTWVILVGEQCSRDTHTAELDLPDRAAFPDPAVAQAWQQERRDLQQEYVRRLVLENHLRHTANNDTELENIVLKLRDELAELRLREDLRHSRLWRAVVAVLIGLLMLGGGGWWGTQLLQTTVQQTAVVNIERIRAHLRTTIEETRRQELEQAESATDWRDRQERRKAAEANHAARLMRVDELATSFAEIEAQGESSNVFRELGQVLAQQGVDEAIAYVATQKPNILAIVRSRTAAMRERNRSELEPLLQAAYLHQTMGQSSEARSLYAEILDLEPDWTQALHAAFLFYMGEGRKARVYSSLAEAARNQQEAHHIVLRLTNKDPTNSEWRQNLAASHHGRGQVLMAHGDVAGALADYQAGREIIRSLTKLDPTQITWQRDLAVSHQSVGNALQTQGKLLGASAEYQKGIVRSTSHLQSATRQA